jgi:hypothetical protein
MRRLPLALTLSLAATTLQAEPGIRCTERDPGGPTGSYYRKVMSPSGTGYAGLRGSVTLPIVDFDPAREFQTDAPHKEYENGPLDRPSVYMGVSSDKGQIDAGLTWDRVYDASKKPTGFAFRPFWRSPTIAWANPPVGDATNVYFQPGETVQMEFRRKDDATFHLSISGKAGKFTMDIAADLPPQLSYKRVNAIDQFEDLNGKRVSTEKKSVLPTATQARESRWLQAMLISPDEPLPDTPLAGGDCVEVSGKDITDYSGVFKISGLSSDGGESLDIVPPAQ